MLYYLKEGKNAIENGKKDLGSVRRRCSDQMCQKWAAKSLAPVDTLAKRFSAEGLSPALEDLLAAALAATH